MLTVLANLLRIVRPYQWWMLLAAILGFATIGSGIGLLATAAYILAKASLHPPFTELQLGIAGVRFFGIIRGVLRYIERLVSHNTTFKTLSKVRAWFYESLEPLAPARLVQYKSGDLLQRITADIDILENLYARVIAPPLTAIMVTALMWIWLGTFSLTFSITLFIFHAVASVGIPLLTGYLNRGTATEISAVRTDLQTGTIDCIQGIGDLMVFNRFDDHAQHLRELKKRELFLQRKQALVQGSHESLTGLLMNGAVLALAWTLAPTVSAGGINGVYAALIIIAVMASFEAFFPLPDAAQHLESNTAAGKRLFEIVDAAPAVTAPEHPEQFPAQNSIGFDSVTFTYPGNHQPALSNASFTVNEGEKIAIVGPSGAGKSTVTNLLLRFWNPSAGKILIGGTSIEHLDPETIRQNIGIVSQKTYLFGTSIRENLLLAKPVADDEELKQALAFAGLEPFGSKLDQWAGQHGMNLSGGERQRMAIARLFLQNTRIVILDEATVNLDTITEKSVMQSILELCDRQPAKTLLAVTHRLRNMGQFDRIIVFKNGRIVEEGSHHELLKKNGLYASMWTLQHRNVPAGILTGS